MKSIEVLIICQVALSMFSEVIVCGQPQYRVTVSRPVSASNVNEDTAFIVLCFREAFSMNNSRSYCPLGLGTFQSSANNGLGELDLGEGANDLAVAYSNEVGLLVAVFDSAINATFPVATRLFPQLNGTIGTEFSLGPNETIANSVQLTANFTVNCVPEFTGSDCTTSTLPTTPSSDPTTEDPTTEAPPTDDPRATTLSGSVSTTPVRTGSEGQSIVPIVVGAGVGGAVVIILVIIIVMVMICVLRKRKAKPGRYKENCQLNEANEEVGNGTTPLYTMVDKKLNNYTLDENTSQYEPSHDGVPIEESLYDYSSTNGAESADQGTEGAMYNKLSHGVQKPSKQELIDAQNDTTYNHISLDQSTENTYNTIPQHLQPNGNEEEATYNQLSHDIQRKHAKPAAKPLPTDGGEGSTYSTLEEHGVQPLSQQENMSHPHYSNMKDNQTAGAESGSLPAYAVLEEPGTLQAGPYYSSVKDKEAQNPGEEQYSQVGHSTTANQSSAQESAMYYNTKAAVEQKQRRPDGLVYADVDTLSGSSGVRKSNSNTKPITYSGINFKF